MHKCTVARMACSSCSVPKEAAFSKHRTADRVRPRTSLDIANLQGHFTPCVHKQTFFIVLIINKFVPRCRG